MVEKRKNPLLEREFIMCILAFIGGIVLYLMDEKDFGGTLIVASVGTYGISRGLAKFGGGFAKVILMGVTLMFLMACNKGMVRADAIDGSIQKVTERHDRYIMTIEDVNGDGKVDKYDKLDRETYLRTTELLRLTVKAALKN